MEADTFFQTCSKRLDRATKYNSGENSMGQLRNRIATGLVLISLIGCDRGEKNATVVKTPRPVIVKALSLRPPPSATLVTASVASWKTEEIGFEIEGRVEWVVEPNVDVEGRVVDGAGNLIVEGTPIAEIDRERYQLQVDTAEADVERAKQSVAAAEIELEKNLQSQLRAAEAETKLAQSQLERSRQLLDQNAGTKSDVDRDEANLQSAVARIEQVQALQKAKQAEIRSLELQIKQAEKALQDAERNLQDCTLFSSFRGQIADVSVVPGSVVNAGKPVATVQMMDPIKIELEVSAADSRRLRKRQRLPVRVTQADGGVTEEDGFLYLVDPVADPRTRTFTLTLLMLNRKTNPESDESDDSNIAKTDQSWRVDFRFLPGAQDGILYAIDQSIHEDQEGHYVWRIDSLSANESLPPDRLVKVSKMRIEKGKAKLPFLGNWLFQDIKILDDSFDPSKHLIAGKLTGTGVDADDWDGDTILIDRGNQWMIRPGDLVQVDLSDRNIEPGYYVPMDAISFDGDKTSVFVVENSRENATVKQVEIKLVDARGAEVTSSMRRIEPLSESVSLEGLEVVLRGAHYLVDGERVTVTGSGEDAS